MKRGNISLWKSAVLIVFAGSGERLFGDRPSRMAPCLGTRRNGAFWGPIDFRDRRDFAQRVHSASPVGLASWDPVRRHCATSTKPAGGDDEIAQNPVGVVVRCSEDERPR